LNASSENPLRSSTPITGQTIFTDRPLRLRSLTVSSANLEALEGSSGIERAFKIRLGNRPGPRGEARAIVERRYARRGYRLPADKRDPYLFTFLAYDDGQIVGTVGVRLDSDGGLHADELYRTEVDLLRREGYRVCEFTRLALDSAFASKPVLAALFHSAYLYAAVINGYSHAVIEVNPRHMTYYVKVLGFHSIGPERLNRRVNAVAVLLCVPFAVIAERTAKDAGHPDLPESNHSLFQYGFPPADENGVLQRLRSFVAERPSVG